MATVIVNGQEIEIDDDQRLNGIEAAKLAGVEVPHYCWHKGLTVAASCRMCLVETGRRDPETGEVSMLPKLVPGCQTPATDGTVFVTESEKVIAARAMVEEDLLLRHPIDCPICDKAGECALQDYHFQHGRESRRADIEPFHSRRRSLGDTVTLFVDRCVMCTRCVRFTREVSGGSELMVVNRGAHEEIDVFPGHPLDHPLSGNVVDLCPVGALGDKDFLYKQRVWFMKRREGVCAGCSRGCSIDLDENQNQLYRIKPRENQHINQWWICDEGRYGWKHVHSEKRLTQPRQFDGQQHVDVQWDKLPGKLDAALRDAKRLAVLFSPHMTVEEAFLLGNYIRSIDNKALLALGPIPREGEDQEFLGGFKISAEKCPNRRGVEEVLAHLGGPSVRWEELPERLKEENIQGLWVSAGYKSDWHDEAVAEKLADLPLLVLVDMFASPLWERAHFQLPAAAFAEREGSYVNEDDRLQAFEWAICPPAGVHLEGRLYWRLLGRSGMFSGEVVRRELAAAAPRFAAAAGDVPDVGVVLTTDQLVDAS